MTDPVIVDCGPALNFLATRQERILLHATGGYISAPETVRQEVFRKAKPGTKFAAAASTWLRLELAKRLTVLPDDLTPALEAVVQRLSNTPMIERMAISKDLGEELVIAHAVVEAEAGADVIMLIDDIRGAAAATREIKRLERFSQQGKAVGSLSLYSTHTIHPEGGRPDKVHPRSKGHAIRVCTAPQLRRWADPYQSDRSTRQRDVGLSEPRVDPDMR